VDREEVYEAWAPEESAWSDWVKPVLFAHLPEAVAPESLEVEENWREVARRCAGDFAVVVDLPGRDGVVLGLALAYVGYRAVPLYNALPHRSAFVDLEGTMEALANGATQLPALPPTAPPAFLVDESRTAAPSVSFRAPGYDNRSVVRGTDFPSPGKLAGAGIRRALLIRATLERPAPDLEAVLLEWQQHGIELWRLASNDATSPQLFRLEPRPWYTRVWAWLIRSSPQRRWDGTYGRFSLQGG
jgi:hypothetical protein